MKEWRRQEGNGWCCCWDCVERRFLIWGAEINFGCTRSVRVHQTARRPCSLAALATAAEPSVYYQCTRSVLSKPMVEGAGLLRPDQKGC
ncbi:hypothetical protein E2C01_079195 [Portunus trituberculatus]|uniref:Uncharacterized protein n=1 Tax=Portunus trituberculatus TaxID=210409 RepID=A0A5B7ISN4_PORTR|nr:hypothetical protein [Portunus trituberculatus]